MAGVQFARTPEKGSIVGEDSFQDDKMILEGYFNRLSLDTDRLINPLGLDHHGFNMDGTRLSEDETRYRVHGMKMIEPMQLFNILMKREADGYPSITDPNYLLLLGITVLLMSY